MLAIIVPFRSWNAPERLPQLTIFLNHIREKLPNAFIYVIEQADSRPFNRGALLNAGVDIAGISRNDIVCFHDVDLIPTGDILYDYLVPLDQQTCRHIGAAFTRYESESYLGGILLMRKGDFMDINGFPTNFWGWGGEDDELRDRINRKGLKIERSSGNIVDLENLSLTQKLSILKRTDQKCMNKWELRDWHRQNPNSNGIHSLDYQITGCSFKLNENTHYYQILIKNE